MRPWLLILPCLLGATGCTTASLTRNTVAQGASTTELRYREVMDGLATVADNAGALPAYAAVYTGSAVVTDTEQLVSTTMWQHVKGAGSQNGFASEAANPQFTRSVGLNWSIDPLIVPEKLEAARAACRWAVYGPERLTPEDRSLLASPEQSPTPGRHFGVADRLAGLPPGWLGKGTHQEVPASACYKGHCGSTWVWVMPEGMAALAEFTVVIQDIARVYSNSPSLFAPPVPTSAVRIVTDVGTPVGPCPDHNPGAVAVVLTVDPLHHLVPPTPYYPVRIDNVSTESHFSSKISAASITP